MAMEKNKWSDISVEQYREYIYSDFVLRINEPVELHVSESSLGGHAHRVVTTDGTAFYVAPGWKAISWKVKVGNKPFKF